jgi:beta-glucanase (GH16 family)
MVGGLERIGSQILTQSQFSQTYGYFEVRVQMPAGSGEGGAIWLMPESGAWPPEVDIAEVSGSSPTTLSTTLLLDPDAPISTYKTEPDMSHGFHTYAVDLEPDKTTWYFDNQGAASPATIGQMKIDWVHVYDSNPYAPAPTTTGAAPQSSDIVDLGNVTLTATPATHFILSGTGHDTVISNFDSASNVIDFEMTSQDFANIAFSEADDHALIDFDGNHVSLPGVTLDQLGWNNFTIGGLSNPHPT